MAFDIALRDNGAGSFDISLLSGPGPKPLAATPSASATVTAGLDTFRWQASFSAQATVTAGLFVGQIDPYYGYVQMISHFDGANNGTVFTDNSQSARTLTKTGLPVTSTTTPKYGTASLATTATLRYLTVTGFNWRPPPTGFTVEGWLKATNITNPITIAEAYGGLTKASGGMGFSLRVDGGSVTFTVGETATGDQIGYGGVSYVGVNTGVWTHIAGVVQGRKIWLYVDGVLASPGFADLPSDTSWCTAPVVIGATKISGAFVSGTGFLDDVRITYAARYTDGATFTPPAVAMATQWDYVGQSVTLAASLTARPSFYENRYWEDEHAAYVTYLFKFNTVGTPTSETNLGTGAKQYFGTAYVNTPITGMAGVTISSAQKVFGAGSLAYTADPATNVVIPVEYQGVIPTTLEMRFRISAWHATDGYQTLFQIFADNTYYQFPLYEVLVDNAGSLSLRLCDASLGLYTYNLSLASATGAVSLNTWYSLSVEIAKIANASGASLTYGWVHLGGLLVASGSCNPVSLNTGSSAGRVTLGYTQDPLLAKRAILTGFIDEVRITQDIVRYGLVTYLPSGTEFGSTGGTVAYPQEAGDDYKLKRTLLVPLYEYHVGGVDWLSNHDYGNSNSYIQNVSGDIGLDLGAGFTSFMEPVGIVTGRSLRVRPVANSLPVYASGYFPRLSSYPGNISQTIELRFRLASLPQVGSIYTILSVEYYGPEILTLVVTPSGSLDFSVNTSGNCLAGFLAMQTLSASIAIDTWYEVEISFGEATYQWRYFINGVQISTIQVDASHMPVGAGQTNGSPGYGFAYITLGATVSRTNAMDGWLEGIRIAMAERHTSSFTYTPKAWANTQTVFDHQLATSAVASASGSADASTLSMLDPYYANTVLSLVAIVPGRNSTIEDISAAHRQITGNTGGQLPIVGVTPSGSVAYRFVAGVSSPTTPVIQIPITSDLDFGTGDFTIEAVIWTSPINLYEVLEIASSWDISGNAAYRKWRLYAIYNGTDQNGSYIVAFAYATTTLLSSANTFVYTTPSARRVRITVVQSSGVLSLYADGVLVQSISGHTPPTLNTIPKIQIGAVWSVSENCASWHENDHYVEQIRITKGIARHSSAFTPPSIAHALPYLDGSGIVPVTIGANASASAVFTPSFPEVAGQVSLSAHAVAETTASGNISFLIELGATAAARSVATAKATRVLRIGADVQAVAAATADLTQAGAVVAVNCAADLQSISTLTATLALGVPLSAAPIAAATFTPTATIGFGLASTPVASASATAAMSLAVSLAATATSSATAGGALGKGVTVGATASSTALAGATLWLGTPLASNAVAVGLVAGALSIDKPIAAAPQASSSATGTLAQGVNLASSAQAASTATADVGITRLFAASTSATPIATAALSLEVSLAANPQATASVDATLAGTGNSALGAVAVAQAAATGDIKVTVNLAATPQASASLTTTPLVTRLLAATPLASSATTATLALGVPLASSAQAIAVFTPTIAGAGLVTLGATVVASATLTATVANAIFIASTPQAAASATAAISVAKPLGASAQATTSVTVANVLVTRLLAAAPTASAILTPTVTVGKSLAASPAAVATFTPALSSTLAAHAIASATVTAALAVGVRLGATSVAAPAVTATLSLTVKLGASPAAVAAMAPLPSLTSLGVSTLAAMSVASANATGALKVGVTLGANAQAQATVTAIGRQALRLASTPQAVASATGAVSSTVDLGASVLVAASASATATIIRGIAAAAVAQVTATAALAVAKLLASDAGAEAVSEARIERGVILQSISICEAAALATLRVETEAIHRTMSTDISHLSVQARAEHVSTTTRAVHTRIVYDFVSHIEEARSVTKTVA